MDFRARDDLEQKQVALQMGYDTREHLKRTIRRVIETELQMEVVR